MKDPIVEEVRQVREEHAAEFGFDLDRIYKELKRLEDEGANPRVSLSPRLVERPAQPEPHLEPAH